MILTLQAARNRLGTPRADPYDHRRGAPLSRFGPAPATDVDAPEILVLQRCCWVTEAIVNDRVDIPALHESLDDVRAGLAATDWWTVRRDERLVGGVRGTAHGTDWDIGRLMVAPDVAGLGMGRALLAFAEGRAPRPTRRFTLFTGARSERNQRMYGRAGYVHAGPAVDHAGRELAGALLMTKIVR